MSVPTRFLSPLRCLLAGVALSALAPMAAQAQYRTQYTVTTDLQSPPIVDVVMLEADSLDLDAASLSMTRPFYANGYGLTTVLDNPFDSAVPMVQSLLFGIVTDLPNDAPGQQHLVLMMDPAAAANAANIAWGTIFTQTLEENLLAAVHTVSTNFDYNDPVVTDALNTVFDFGRTQAGQANLGPNGTTGSAWFTTGGAFTVMAWSDGQAIGSGVSAIVQTVPEPGTWALWLGGLALMAGVARRTRAA